MAIRHKRIGSQIDASAFHSGANQLLLHGREVQLRGTHDLSVIWRERPLMGNLRARFTHDEASVFVVGDNGIALLDAQDGKRSFADTRFDASSEISSCGHYVTQHNASRVSVRSIETGAEVWGREFDKGGVRACYPLRGSDDLWVVYVSRPRPHVESIAQVWKWPFGEKPLYEYRFESYLPYGFNQGLRADGSQIVHTRRHNSARGGSKHILMLTSSNGDTVDLCGINGSVRGAYWAESSEQVFIASYRHWFWVDLKNGEVLEQRPTPYGTPVVSRRLELTAFSSSFPTILFLARSSDPGIKAQINFFRQAFDQRQILVRGDHERNLREFKEFPGKRWARVEKAYAQKARIVVNTNEALNKLLMPHRRSTWKTIVEYGEGSTQRSKFGGGALLREGENWPRCRRCHEPLDLFLQLSSDDLPADYTPSFDGYLQLFLCTKDVDDECVTWEPFSVGTELRLLPNTVPLVEGQSPSENALLPSYLAGWEKSDDYPSYDELEGRFGVELDSPGGSDVNIFATSISTDKLGGWADWVQGMAYPACQQCDTRMEFIYQLCGRHISGYMFGDGGVGHIFQCPKHPGSLAFWWAGS